MEAVYFNTRRSGYMPEQCYSTITVGELIETLEQYDEDLPVYFRNDDGYTYGEIEERDINTRE